MAKIFHILPKEDLKQAKAQGVYRPPSLKTEQFIHCSKTDQLLEVANKFYKNTQDLVIIRIDEDKVASRIVHEAPKEAPLCGILYPHIYGELNMEAIEKEFPFNCNGDGLFTLPKNLLK